MTPLTLTNPTDDQLDEALAKAVDWKPTTDGGICWDGAGKAIISYPSYSSNYNEVMPLLAGYLTNIVITPRQSQVVITSAKVHENQTYSAYDKSPTRAVAIALLRAKGVIVIIEDLQPQPNENKTTHHA